MGNDIEPELLQVTCAVRGSDVVLTVAGEIDMSTADVLRRAVTRAPRPVGGRLVFDLAEVSFIDSSGLAVLLENRTDDGMVWVTRPSAAVQRLIESTGLSGVIVVAP